MDDPSENIDIRPKTKLPYVRWVADLQSKLFVVKDHSVISLNGQ